MHRSTRVLTTHCSQLSWCVLKNSHLTSLAALNLNIPIRHKKTSSRNPSTSSYTQGSSHQQGQGLSHLFVPIPVKSTTEDSSVGIELAGKLNKQDVLQVLNKFFRRSEVKLLSAEHGLDSKTTYFIKVISNYSTNYNVDS